VSSKEIRNYLNCIILENVEERSLKIKRLLYTYTIGLLAIPARYKDSVKAACEGNEFYISGYDTVWREARNLHRREHEYQEYDDVFHKEEHDDHLFDAIDETVDELMTLIIEYMQETFEVEIVPKPIPMHDVDLLIDAIYAIYTGRTNR
jgi:hypothetical protein